MFYSIVMKDIWTLAKMCTVPGVFIIFTWVNFEFETTIYYFIHTFWCNCFFFLFNTRLTFYSFHFFNSFRFQIFSGFQFTFDHTKSESKWTTKTVFVDQFTPFTCTLNYQLTNRILEKLKTKKKPNSVRCVLLAVFSLA